MSFAPVRAVDRMNQPPPAVVYLTPGHRRKLPPDLRGRFRDLDHFLRDLVSSATERLLIVSPYLGPAGMAMLRAAMAVSAEQGAWIRFVTADLTAVDGINRRALAVLLEGREGRIIRTRMRVLTGSPEFPVLLHAKIVVVDARRGYLGSANLSGRALDENFEVGTALAAIQAKALDDLVAYLEAQGLLVDYTDTVLQDPE